MVKQLDFFNSDDYLTPDSYCKSGDWAARITAVKGKRRVQLRSPNGETKSYAWPYATTDQMKVLLNEAEKLGDFPDIVVSRPPHYTINSVDPDPTPNPGDSEKVLENQAKAHKKRKQSGWIQKSYRMRVDGRQMTILHWQPGATGPYYCYRYKKGKRTPGVYIKKERYGEVLAAINANKSVVEILQMLYGG